VLDIQQGVADLAQVMQFDPTTPHLIDWKKVVRKLWEIRGTEDLLVTEAEFEKAMKQLQAEQQQQQQMQLAAGAAQAMGQAAPFIKATREGAGAQPPAAAA
jgi:hypothetical protein